MVLKKVTFKSTGIYRCEVTTKVEGGQWVVKESTQKMVVVGKTRKLGQIVSQQNGGTKKALNHQNRGTEGV